MLRGCPPTEAPERPVTPPNNQERRRRPLAGPPLGYDHDNLEQPTGPRRNGGGSDILLRQRGDIYEIRFNGIELM